VADERGQAGHELPLTLRRTELLMTVPVAAARRAARQAE